MQRPWDSTGRVESAGPGKPEADWSQTESEALRCAPQGICREVRGQLVEEVASLLPPQGSQGSKSMPPGLAASAFTPPTISMALKMFKDDTGC